MRARGTSGKHLGRPPYGYRSNPQDKDRWIQDEEAAPVVKRIFDLAMAGRGPNQIARILEQDQELTTKALYAQRKGKPLPDQPCHWGEQSVIAILERIEYTGCVRNFKTYSKSYKLKKRVPNRQEDMFILPDTPLGCASDPVGAGGPLPCIYRRTKSIYTGLWSLHRNPVSATEADTTSTLPETINPSTVTQKSSGP